MHAPDHTVPSDSLSLHLADEAATKSFGAALGAVLQSGDLVTLEGDLGAGKTTLVRGLLEGLGYTGKVKSPTYALVEPHVVSGLNLYHFDFYRLNQPEEYLEAGLDEYFAGQGVCLVEWPDKAAPYLPAPDLRVELAVADSVAMGREARLQAVSERGRACLSAFTQQPPPR